MGIYYRVAIVARGSEGVKYRNQLTLCLFSQISFFYVNNICK